MYIYLVGHSARDAYDNSALFRKRSLAHACADDLNENKSKRRDPSRSVKVYVYEKNVHLFDLLEDK